MTDFVFNGYNTFESSRQPNFGRSVMKNLLCLGIVSFAFIIPAKTFGCTIPVFRYALEKWELTPYEVLVYHRGPLPADVEKELKKWEGLPKNANIEITLIDLDAPLSKAHQRIWTREGNDKQTPWMIVRYAAADPMEPSSWKGACTVANFHGVMDSPMRRAVLAHLTRGASTVFVFMTSDDAAKDRADFDMLTKELQGLEKKIKLPDQSDTGPQIKLPIPLKVSFPILVLDRKRAEEAGFVRLLLGTEERLADMKGPIVFPIFGRGRVLGGLVGEKEINPQSVMDVAKFLCRECSCQVKELNPGIDMLMVTNWNDAFDQLYDGKQPIAMPTLAPTPLSEPARKLVPKSDESKSGGTTSQRAPADASVLTAQNSLAPSVQSPPSDRKASIPMNLRFVLWLGVGAASGLVLLSGGWVIYQVRRNGSSS